MMTMAQYHERSAAHAAEAKQALMKALSACLPAGHVLSDDPRQMYANALLRMKPEHPQRGDCTLFFMHSIAYKGTSAEGGYRVIPTAETVTAIADIYGDTLSLDGCAEFGDSGRVKVPVQADDIASAVRQLVSLCLSQPPLVRFAWRRVPSEGGVLALCVDEEDMAEIRKAGSRWNLETGQSMKTQEEARAVAEDNVSAVIATRYQERLASVL